MVAGMYPWTEHKQKDLFRQIISCDFYLPNTVQPEVKLIISMCMQKDQNQRPAAEQILANPWLAEVKVPKRRKMPSESTFGKVKMPLIVRPRLETQRTKSLGTYKFSSVLDSVSCRKRTIEQEEPSLLQSSL